LAIQAVATAPADGYTLLVMANSSVLAQALSALRGTPAHDIERDLAPVSAVAIQPLVLLVNPALPVKSVKEFVALVKAKPNAVNYGSSGIGGASHLAGELFNLLADVKLFHVPYKGGSESVVAAAAGTIQATFASTTSAKALMDSGKLRPLAVTSLNRTQLLPSAPSVNESGVAGYDAVVWYAVMVPTAVPAPIVGQLNTILAKIVMAPDMKEPFLRQGLEPQSGSPQQLRTMIRNEFVQSIKLIKAADLKPDQ
jgi:tripartite-type tricarboxylate transporter receptor subunit TctC